MKLFQIYYDDASRAALDPNFIPLDNIGPERPDWFEYWPIRKTLLKYSFGDEEYVGFFSPRFKEKTGLSGSDVIERMSIAKSDVVSFSPLLHEGCLYFNTFYQAEVYHPGCIRSSQAFLESVGVKLNLSMLVQDQTRTIFSNYFVAKYRFWKKWERLANQLFEICEDQGNPLGVLLNENTLHRDQESTYQMKIFIMERIVSIVLELEKLDAEKGVGYVENARWGNESTLRNLLILEALKGQYIKTGEKVLMGLYATLRKEFFPAFGRKP